MGAGGQRLPAARSFRPRSGSPRPHSAPAPRPAPADAAGRGDVVFLDQDAVVQRHALVLAAAHAHRVLLRLAQARQGLARVEDARRAGWRPRRRSGAWRVATPDSSCRKFSAVRSADSSARGGPRCGRPRCRPTSGRLRRSSSRSMCGSTRAHHALEPGRAAQHGCLAHEHARARALSVGSSRPVRSPRPMSSKGIGTLRARWASKADCARVGRNRWYSVEGIAQLLARARGPTFVGKQGAVLREACRSGGPALPCGAPQNRACGRWAARASSPVTGSTKISARSLSSTATRSARPFIAIQGQCAQLLQVAELPAVGASISVLPGAAGRMRCRMPLSVATMKVCRVHRLRRVDQLRGRTDDVGQGHHGWRATRDAPALSHPGTRP